MPLHELGSVPAALAWLAHRGARALVTDSRRVAASGPGAAFIAWPGYANDARQFVGTALNDGAVACILEADGVQPFNFARSDRLAVMHGLKAQTGPIASGFFGMPSDRLSVLAVTGTNGKTSTAWWTAQALGALGRRCGVVGTLGVGEPPAATTSLAAPAEPMPIVATGLTTPDPVTLHAAFRRFADAGFSACAVEASSIGLDEHRLSGTRIDVALLTNVTQDHLDYHGSMADYWRAKAQLFSWPGLRAAVLNADDAHGAALAAPLRQRGIDVWAYSTQPAPHATAVRLQARGIGYSGGGLAFEVCEGAGGAAITADVRSALIGDYNVANLLAVIGGLRALGISLADAAAACGGLTPVPGRMQRVTFEDGKRPAAAGGDARPSAIESADGAAAPEHEGADGRAAAGVAVTHQAVAQAAAADRALPEVVVDYAHTPDALDKALRALSTLAAARGGALWCVFGCGGDRDAAKRPLMGALAQRLARHVVVTSDNPRSEVPAAVIAGIVGGMASAGPRPVVVEDRRAAIGHAIDRAQPADVVLVAGKGHEDYQEVAGIRHPFDDAVEARAALARRAGAPLAATTTFATAATADDDRAVAAR